MYLEKVTLKFIQPCTTDSKRIRIKANLSKDISDIFPYLNTYIPSAIYNSKGNHLTFNKEHKIITLFEDNIAIAKLINETDAYETMDYIKELINEVYENKHNIEPLYEIKKMPSPIDLYKYLPKLNCKRCKEATCMAFAAKLLSSENKITSCIPLYEDQNKEKRYALEDLILSIGYEI